MPPSRFVDGSLLPEFSSQTAGRLGNEAIRVSLPTVPQHLDRRDDVGHQILGASISSALTLPPISVTRAK